MEGREGGFGVGEGEDRIEEGGGGAGFMPYHCGLRQSSGWDRSAR